MKQNIYKHLNTFSLSYHHFELTSKVLGISKKWTTKSKLHISNIYLPISMYEHTPTESSKEGRLLYLHKNLMFKLRKT